MTIYTIDAYKSNKSLIMSISLAVFDGIIYSDNSLGVLMGILAIFQSLSYHYQKVQNPKIFNL